MSTATISPTITRPCGRCDGSGRIRAFSNIAGGICFECEGRGSHVTTVAKERRRVADQRRRAAKRVTDGAARVEAFVTAYLTKDITAGLTAQESHDDRCWCRGFCWTTHNGGAQAARWVELGGVL